MNLEQLRGFVEVARQAHFTRAAEALHLAQPSLSRQIATLEQDLGAELFHRARGHISLTAAGEALLPLARRMLADADSVRHEMAELTGLRKGRVRLGATPSLCASIVTDVVSAFHSAHPGVDIHISERGSRRLIGELAEGALDLALLTSTAGVEPQTVSLSRTALLTEELVVVSSAAQPPVTARRSMTISELAALPQIAFAESYDLRAVTDAAFRNAGLTPEVVLEGAEMDAVLRFVERGLGVAVVPAMVPIDRAGLRAVRLTEPRLDRTVSLAQRSDVTLTRAAAAMRSSILRVADEYASRGTSRDRLVTRAG
ncbi:DNA-binding transcriptional LysR family regulator [Diaminobutyricimonas aerilata]|uniref:DNA-binding transcriptional LysR family regulator n=1 Tax=Diaminobutyricimonas aerilata TaxID=1162967 RepID=A0A2M9CNU3_9MICO|nr:LysR substrate-binding domain-containing protein [Diaminobutyricimonas aerilata]PJJ73538.1 DNA-binding transcriptional LysR family regulator [Diaminobutyricimonas aerilata]